MNQVLCTFALAGLLVAGAMSAQQSRPDSATPTPPGDQQQSTPRTFPENEQQPVPIPLARPEIQPPMPSSPTTSSVDLATRVLRALHQQLPESTDQVGISLADDGSLELRGTVATDRERQQVEDVAHSIAANCVVVNKLRVGGFASRPSSGRSALPKTN